MPTLIQIENGTDDDAKVKVSGGPGSVPPKKGRRYREVNAPEWCIRGNEKMDFAPRTLPVLPWTVFISVKKSELTCHVKSTTTLKGLKLVKEGNGYTIKKTRRRGAPVPERMAG
jgi:hypothetical protein